MRRNNTQMTTNILIVSLLLIGVVYALLQSNLNINGIAKILHNTWDVHFDNIQVNEDSVPIGENDSQATIDPENNCKIDFEVTLNIPGDFYEFTVDVVNEGTIDGMIGTLNKTLTINNETVEETPDYLNYTITYDDGVEIEENHKVTAGTVETYKVRLEFKTDIEELPQAATIVTSLEPQYVQADSSAIEVYHPNRLYNVFKEEYNSGSGLVHEYSGEHKDSFTKNGTQKIYHWYADKTSSGNTKANQILDKNNVIFANHCWQMIRTTDTGGVKLIYNGETENNQCLTTRGKHIGYNSKLCLSLNDNYWYGTDYSYDPSTQKFSIAGTTEQKRWDDSTYSTLIGKYTCRSRSENGTCNPLYYIESYKDNYYAYEILLNDTSLYSQFGSLLYNADYNSPSSSGYMYGDTYKTEEMGSPISQSLSINNLLLSSSISFSSSYLYSKTINWDGTSYELVNPILGSNIPESSYVEYYTFRSESITSGEEPYYLVGEDYSWYRYVQLSATKQLDYYNILVGESISSNLDGTYSLSGTVSPISIRTWFTNYLSYKGKYTCGDATTTSCSNPRRIVDSTKTNYSYLDAGEKIMIAKTRNGLTLTDTLLVRKDEWYSDYNNYEDYKYTCNSDNAVCTEDTLRIIVSYKVTGYSYFPNHYFGSSVTWDGTNYTLVDPIDVEYYDDYSSISTHHYICISPGLKTCSEVAYIIYFNKNSNTNRYYITLQNGVLTIDSAIEGMFTKNTNNSIIKTGIDAWYKKYMLDYDNYIEDTIYCNDRSIETRGAWDANGGMPYSPLNYTWVYLSNNLNCPNITDQFSIYNSNARLSYKVGLITGVEMNILNNSIIRNTGTTYWLNTPNSFITGILYQVKVTEAGSISTAYPHNSYGIRPAISLKPGIKYDDGDGSKEHPYIIKTN